jgi:succinyl-diaminopimelate desuccinylase
VSADPLSIARDLVRCPSVTPAEGGALTFLEGILKKNGFTVHRMTFREPGTDDVENLYARIGAAAPNLVIAGHTDVVPTGDEKAWTHPPFSGEVANGELYGRGAVDMKGGIACAVAAVLDHLSQHGGKPKGSISFLITGDEEGIAVNGTPKLLKWAAERGEKFDHCILAEPSNQEELGDTIKIGRRGSLNGHLIVSGTQGHVAYPRRATNPIRGLVTLISALQAEPLDQGSAQFAPSHLEFTSVDVGNKTVNLIPGEARARFNIRFNDHHTLESLKKLIDQRAAKAAGGKIKFSFQWEPSNAGVFVTKPGPFTDLVAAAIAEITGRKPALSTTGGTSDARFITHHCPVVEFGLVGQTMHAVDERVPVADLRALTTIYHKIIDRYFS